MAILWADGFECGCLSNWNSASGSVVSADYARNSSYGCRITAEGANVGGIVSYGGVDATGAWTTSLRTSATALFNIRFIEIPDTGHEYFLWWTSGVNTRAAIGVNSDRNIVSGLGSPTPVTPTVHNTKISLNKWYTVICSFTSSGVSLYLDGNLVFSEEITLSSIRQIRLGKFSDAGDQTLTIDVDDVVLTGSAGDAEDLTDSYPCIVASVPFADASKSDFTPSEEIEEDFYALVNDIPYDTNTYLYSDTADNVSSFYCSFSPVIPEAGTPLGVIQTVLVLGAAPLGSAGLIDVETNSIVGNQWKTANASTTAGIRVGVWDTTEGAAWDTDKLDLIEFFISGTGSALYTLYECTLNCVFLVPLPDETTTYVYPLFEECDNMLPAPFVPQTPIDFDGTSYYPVTIPSGHRLVISCASAVSIYNAEPTWSDAEESSSESDEYGIIDYGDAKFVVPANYLFPMPVNAGQTIYLHCEDEVTCYLALC